MTQLENDKKQIQDAIICECGLTFQAIHIGNCEKYITKGSLYVDGDELIYTEGEDSNYKFASFNLRLVYFDTSENNYLFFDQTIVPIIEENYLD